MPIDQSKDPELHQLLYGSRDGYVLPYTVMRYIGGMVHYPGLHGVTDSAPNHATGISTGYRGIAVQSYADPVTAHPVQLRWGGIDVDAGDNLFGDHTSSGLPVLVTAVQQVLPMAMVRLSKSGKGVHVIIRLKPEQYKVCSYDEAKAYAKALVAEPKRKLADAGIVTCVTGLPNLWLWSEHGHQRTVQVGEPVDWPGCNRVQLPTSYSGTQYDGGTVSLSDFTGAPLRIVCLWFDQFKYNTGEEWRRLPARSQVNVGRFLRVTGMQVPTRSKCRPEHAHEPNGWIELGQDGSFRLFSNADNNTCILALYSL